MTELLYAREAYLKEFDATVVEHRDGAIVLDRTAFYPTGGGQPHDLGRLESAGTSWPVVEVRKQGPDVLHRLGPGQPLPDVGSTLHGSIDWERRYALMRHHSALHVLCGVIHRLTGALVTGGQMYVDRARMDFALADLSPERLREIEEVANQRIAEDHPIHVKLLPRDEAFQIPDLIRTQINLLPPNIAEIRIIDIEDVDLQADGGVHVNSTAEIGRIRITKTENKGKINKRLEIVLE
jgi:misacylated tRNA(Ala) deacylase